MYVKKRTVNFSFGGNKMINKDLFTKLREHLLHSSEFDSDEMEEILENTPNTKNYKKAYHILMEFFDSIPDEEKQNVDKRLKGCGL